VVDVINLFVSVGQLLIFGTAIFAAASAISRMARSSRTSPPRPTSLAHRAVLR
jgi:hypothetical protein